MGAAAAERGVSQRPRFPPDDALYEQELAAVRGRLTADEFQSAWAEGERMGPEQAAAYALQVSAGIGGDDPESAGAAEAGPRPSPARGTPSRGPAAAGLTLSPAGLPRQLTSFVGREAEVAEVARLLQDAPLVTLTGVGGVGKTRLAQEAASRMAGAWPDGVCFVDLAPLSDPGLVPHAVAAALDIREAPGRPLLATLSDALGPRRLLLVLDNCEHLVEACAGLAGALLRACPDLRVLATSREALRVAGEVPYRVPSLAVPATDGPLPVEALTRSDAVRLFAARAAVVHPGFTVTAGNGPAVTAVCRRLDGIPLALELAAAWARTLSVEQIAGRLDDRFRLLVGGPRAGLARHQTLRAAVDWSYDLVTAPERALFARLAVFAGGFTLEAAEAVGADDPPETPAAGRAIAAPEVLERLTRLVDTSLVQVDGQTAGAARYRLLETLRQYAGERLAASGEAAAAQRRHAAHYLALAEQAAPELEGPRQRAWLDRLEAEQDNLRQALRWSQAEGESAEPREAGLRLAAALGRFWSSRGHQREGRDWAEAALRLPGAAGRTAARAEALRVAGSLAWALGDGAAARARAVASVALWRELGNGRGLGRALVPLGLALLDVDRAAARPVLEEAVAVARAAGDRRGLAGALRILGTLEGRGPGGGGTGGRPSPLEESVALWRELGDPQGLGEALAGLGGRVFRQGDYLAARALFEEALAIRREAGDTRSVAVDLIDLAIVARGRGDLREAAARAEEGRALAQTVGATPLVAEALAHLGHVALAGGDGARAAALLGESLRLVGAHGLEADTWRLARILAGLAGVAAAGGQPERAVRLGAAAAALAAAAGWPLYAPDQAALDGAQARARPAVDPKAQAVAWDEGQALTPEQAVNEGLAVEGATTETASAGAATPDPATARR